MQTHCAGGGKPPAPQNRGHCVYEQKFLPFIPFLAGGITAHACAEEDKRKISQGTGFFATKGGQEEEVGELKWATISSDELSQGGVRRNGWSGWRWVLIIFCNGRKPNAMEKAE